MDTLVTAVEKFKAAKAAKEAEQDASGKGGAEAQTEAAKPRARKSK